MMYQKRMEEMRATELALKISRANEQAIMYRLYLAEQAQKEQERKTLTEAQARMEALSVTCDKEVKDIMKTKK